MRRHPFTLLLVTGLALVMTPAWAQAAAGLGQTEANGCEVFIGEGSGQIVSAWGEEPLTTFGTVVLASRDGSRHYTYTHETIFFPSVAAGEGGARTHSGYENWRLEENGLSGTLRVDLTYTPDDPANPTTLVLLGVGEVIGGNRYKTGGMHFVGEMDYYTGAYTITLFELVFCQ